MMNWICKWLAFLSPVSGWKERLSAFEQGQTAWEVPDRPECNKVIPWPVQWVPHELLDLSDPSFSPEDRARGFQMIEATCIDTGKRARVGEGVNCARCGVPLHPDACTTRGYKAPTCRRCAPLVKLLV